MQACRARISARTIECHHALTPRSPFPSSVASRLSSCTSSTRQLSGQGAEHLSLANSGTADRRSNVHRAAVIAQGVIKAVENYEAGFELEPESQQKLEGLLASPVFCVQVAKESRAPEGSTLQYEGVLFQPTPWSPNTPKGMRRELEKYLDPSSFRVINVPPNFMFSAKIANPTRLCAVYRIFGGAAADAPPQE